MVPDMPLTSQGHHARLISKTLEIIEKSKANLKDDTYIEKFLDGLLEHLQDQETNQTEILTLIRSYTRKIECLPSQEPSWNEFQLRLCTKIHDFWTQSDLKDHEKVLKFYLNPRNARREFLDSVTFLAYMHQVLSHSFGQGNWELLSSAKTSLECAWNGGTSSIWKYQSISKAIVMVTEKVLALHCQSVIKLEVVLWALKQKGPPSGPNFYVEEIQYQILKSIVSQKEAHLETISGLELPGGHFTSSRTKCMYCLVKSENPDDIRNLFISILQEIREAGKSSRHLSLSFMRDLREIGKTNLARDLVFSIVDPLRWELEDAMEDPNSNFPIANEYLSHCTDDDVSNNVFTIHILEEISSSVDKNGTLIWSHVENFKNAEVFRKLAERCSDIDLHFEFDLRVRLFERLIYHLFDFPKIQGFFLKALTKLCSKCEDFPAKLDLIFGNYDAWFRTNDQEPVDVPDTDVYCRTEDFLELMAAYAGNKNTMPDHHLPAIKHMIDLVTSSLTVGPPFIMDKSCLFNLFWNLKKHGTRLRPIGLDLKREAKHWLEVYSNPRSDFSTVEKRALFKMIVRLNEGEYTKPLFSIVSTALFTEDDFEVRQNAFKLFESEVAFLADEGEAETKKRLEQIGALEVFKRILKRNSHESYLKQTLISSLEWSELSLDSLIEGANDKVLSEEEAIESNNFRLDSMTGFRSVMEDIVQSNKGIGQVDVVDCI